MIFNCLFLIQYNKTRDFLSCFTMEITLSVILKLESYDNFAIVQINCNQDGVAGECFLTTPSHNDDLY